MESAKKVMALHCTLTLWNAVSVGDMDMDKPCTGPWVMYFLVVIFHIRTTSSPLSALVFMSQVVVYTIPPSICTLMVTGFSYVTLKVILVLCGIWSLDVFRSVITPFCVNSNVKVFMSLRLSI